MPRGIRFHSINMNRLAGSDKALWQSGKQRPLSQPHHISLASLDQAHNAFGEEFLAFVRFRREWNPVFSGVSLRGFDNFSEHGERCLIEYYRR